MPIQRMHLIHTREVIQVKYVDQITKRENPRWSFFHVKETAYLVS